MRLGVGVLDNRAEMAALLGVEPERRNIDVLRLNLGLPAFILARPGDRVEGLPLPTRTGGHRPAFAVVGAWFFAGLVITSLLIRRRR